MKTFRVQDFLNTVGVNTHLSYTDGGYANVANVVKDLKYLSDHPLIVEFSGGPPAH